MGKSKDFITSYFHHHIRQSGRKFTVPKYKFLQLAHPSDYEQTKYMPDNNNELIHLYDFKMFVDNLNVED